MQTGIPWNYLEQIRAKLWGGPEYGNVGLMVGAGFSRNAENRTLQVLPFPQWGDLAQKMHDELYPESLDSKRLDHLKIADEYEATFGRTRLNELLQEIIPDKDYYPGKLHKMLLKLPWAEIFTTNYDTLLERTLPYVHDRKYDVIKTTNSIQNSRKPRIVKLHGSFPEVSLVSSSAIFAVKWIENYSPLWSISLLVRSKKNDAINKWFDRISTATFDKKIVQQIQPILLKSWRYVIKFIIKDPVETLYDKPLNDYLRYFGILSEVISRLCLHFGDEELQRLLRDAIRLYNTPNLPAHGRSVPEPLCNIFRRVIWAMSEDMLLQEIYNLLSLPMPEANSIVYSAGGRWDDPLKMVS